MLLTLLERAATTAVNTGGPAICSVLGHRFRRRASDPLVLDCERCEEETWDVRERVAYPTSHQPQKGAFDAGAPYCEACGNSLDVTGNNSDACGLTYLADFRGHEQYPGRDEVFLCTGCRFSLFKLGSNIDVDSVLGCIDSSQRPIERLYGSGIEDNRVFH